MGSRRPCADAAPSITANVRQMSGRRQNIGSKMRHTLYTLTLMACILCMPLDTFAQRVTHTYNNVSLSEALLQLNNEQKEYIVNFLYNELEDFRRSF